ncbi:MAG: Crp/Fnr family transcriptional regulator [Candidatus Tectimicrobiota bacterium]
MERVLQRNRLLALLPAAERQALAAQATLVSLQAHDELYPAESPIEYVYFPLTLMASLTEVDIATVGNEGMLGSMIVLNVLRSWGRTLVQVGGLALRLPAVVLLKHLERQPLLRTILSSYQDAFTRHIFQVGTCNLLHTMEERCARWLLMTHDRVDRATFALTQQFLARILGVQRATVSLALKLLRGAGLISYRRGCFHIRDRAGLEAAACPCYAQIRGIYQRLDTELAYA